MGKGDQRSKRGKIYRGTYGKSRLRKDNKKESSGGKDKGEQAEKQPESTEKKETAEASA